MLTAMAMAFQRVFFYDPEGIEHRHSFVYCMSAMCVCVCERTYVKSYGAEGHFGVCTQGQCVVGRTTLAGAVIVSDVFSLSHTQPHMPVSHNSGLIPLFSIICISLFLELPLLPVFSLCRCELLIICLSSPSSPSLFPAPLLQSVSLSCPCVFPSSLRFPTASVFLFVNSWDAFVEGFHSDGPFEEVVIHVCSL